MIIQIDNREKDLIKLCQFVLQSENEKYKDINLIIKPLSIGDILLISNDDEKIIIERKTIVDLSSSIKDGRYDEQSYRLNGSPIHNHNIIYLIEGNFCTFPKIFKNKNIDKMMLYSAMFSLNYYKGFSVLNTNDINETAIMICNMAHKLYNSELKGRIPFYTNHTSSSSSSSSSLSSSSLSSSSSSSSSSLSSSSSSTTSNNTIEEHNEEKDYCSVVKKVKKDNITKENIGEIMLCQIPGISSITAIALMKKFGDLPNLISSIKEDENVLNNISYTNQKGIERKINKSALSNIIKYLKK